MKKISFSAAMLSLALVSCQNEGESINFVNHEVVQLSVGTGVTKAVVSEIAGDVKIYLGADHGVESIVFTYDAEDKSWANNAETTWDQITGIETGVSLFALHNGTENVEFTMDGDTPKLSDFNQDGTIDLLCYSQTINAIPSNGTISAAFSHMMSKLNMKPNILNGSDKPFVQSVGVNNFKNTGNATLSENDVLAWSDLSGAANYSAGLEEEADEVAVANNTIMGEPMLVLPQNVAGATVTAGKMENPEGTNYAELVYRLEDKDGNNVVGFKDIDSYLAATPEEDEASAYADIAFPLFVKVAYPFPSEGYDLIGLKEYDINLSFPGGYSLEENFYDKNGEKTELPVIYPGTGEVVDPKDPVITGDHVIGITVSVNDWTQDSKDL